MSHQADDQETKIQQFFERARKGVLKHVSEKGGTITLSDMHEFSMKTYLIQHQRFSQMMESFVSEALIDYDAMTQEAALTAKGRKFIE